ncbi:hypothetical protein Cs7R123_13210 [Catellatospora sp. TT07R-123]|uniref:hypothetical protein n=1 Tax=Catellatospora sp. TT07R-123 TaxID=2733863 RepID=UPI001B184D16|nr:hypothetical protein [Catellatospora sp. TT07R-123]GHJ43979.1 hypothetical protein Cs7R123_13210 [Catellatospora sp. TT07R-123]
MAGLVLAVVAVAAGCGMLLGRWWRAARAGSGRRTVTAGVRVLRTGVNRVRRRTLQAPRLGRSGRWRRSRRPANRNAPG